jgi:hypothetical protein
MFLSKVKRDDKASKKKRPKNTDTNVSSNKNLLNDYESGLDGKPLLSAIYKHIRDNKFKIYRNQKSN